MHKFWIGFNLVPGIGFIKLRQLLDRFGSLQQAWEASPLELEKAGLDRRTLKNLLAARAALDLDQEWARLEEFQASLLTWGSDDYPAALRELDTPPPVLYTMGEITAEDEFAVAIVGTRKLTAYGKQMTRELTQGLVRKGFTIVSGLARGVDTLAHQTALELGGRTIAVLGSGLDHIYPPENRQIVSQIQTRRQGAVVTEYALGTKPQAKNFPPRNRIISGLSLGIVLIEGGLKSGALITAKFALEQNREIFAVPGNVTSPASEGPNALIQQGARLVTCVEDIVAELNYGPPPEPTAVQLSLPDSPEEAALLRALSRDPQHVDAIARTLQLPASTISSRLALMELKGLVQHVGGMQFVLLTSPYR